MSRFSDPFVRILVTHALSVIAKDGSFHMASYLLIIASFFTLFWPEKYGQMDVHNPEDRPPLPPDTIRKNVKNFVTPPSPSLWTS